MLFSPLDADRIDLDNPLDRDHPDNAGLALALLGLPGYTGGSRWADATGRTAGANIVSVSGDPKPIATPYGLGLGFGRTGSGYLQVPVNLSTAGGALYLSAWVWWSDTTQGWYRSGAAGGGGFTVTNSSTLTYRVNGGNIVTSVQKSTVTNRWVRWHIQTQTSSSELWIDGKRIHLGVGGLPNDSAMVLAANIPPSQTARCDLTGVRIGFRYLNETQIQNDYAWTLDPARDERLRRLRGVAYFFDAGVPLITAGGSGVAAGSSALLGEAASAISGASTADGTSTSVGVGGSLASAESASASEATSTATGGSTLAGVGESVGSSAWLVYAGAIASGDCFASGESVMVGWLRNGEVFVNAVAPLRVALTRRDMISVPLARREQMGTALGRRQELVLRLSRTRSD